MDLDFFSGSVVTMWIVIAVVLAAIEALTQGLTTIWFAGGAIAAAAVATVTDSIIIQILVAIVVSAMLLYFTRPWAVKKFNKEIIRTNISAIIGTEGIALSDIKRNEQGTVKADNKVWTAVLEKDADPVNEGDTVSVVAVEGVKLVVKAAPPEAE